ncbi:urate hydroxylase PuuD [Lentisalinibacter sediminis]|uniref:urate hydroxylase PuuD n=1 Tax=Lentisalinibacter sediminis TaxID=2992237 RepID=UPI003864A0DD
MTAYAIEWLNLLGRWLHFIVGIAWIGSSFYFVWLDNHLVPPASRRDAERGVGGEIWSVHGGGFYHAQKYRVSPPVLPETLHWFKWEAYSTWLSGMFLLGLIYWLGAEVYLIDPAVADLAPTTAIAISVAWLAGGWLVYDALCRSPLGRTEQGLAAVLLVLVTAAAWALCQTFSGRGAYIHFGAVLGTIMVANVFFVIIPGQKRMVAAAAAGETPDPADGLRGKQRSVHNTYFTLPVLFVMISNHYAMTWAHEYNWLILIAISLAGALIRVYFVARHSGRNPLLPPLAAALLLAGVAAAIAPRADGGSASAPVSLAQARAVLEARCVSCHAAAPSHPGFAAPPGGVMLETPEQVLAAATRIHQQTVVLRAMPIGNLTRITEEERAVIDGWYRSLATERQP